MNRITRIHYGNGVETAYSYDVDGNISSLETRAGENILLSFAYQYDGNENRTAKKDTQAGVTPGGITSGITVGSSALDISAMISAGSFWRPECGPFPLGASAFDKPSNAPITGWYHILPKGTQLLDGLAIIADGIDVNPKSPHGVGHHTIIEMTVEKFNELFRSLPRLR